MPPIETRIICKTLQALAALAFVLFNAQSVVAQQWQVGQVPVENSVPQYRPRSAPSSSPNTNAGALPLDFFNDTGSSVLPQVKPAVQEPASLRPALPEPNKAPQVLPPPKKVQTQVLKPKASTPKAEPAKKVAQPKPAAKKKTSKEKASKKELAKGKGKGKDKKKAKAKKQPVLNNEIYHDQSLYPIDPRKPNWPCAGGNCHQQGCQCQSCLALGNQGKPYRDRALGGCQCDSRKPTKHPNFSVHWPRPFSAKLDARHPEAANARYAACQPKRIVDVFDGLSTFKLSDYKRTDNGYSGPGSDPYGCVGESKLR